MRLPFLLPTQSPWPFYPSQGLSPLLPASGWLNSGISLPPHHFRHHPYFPIEIATYTKGKTGRLEVSGSQKPCLASLSWLNLQLGGSSHFTLLPFYTGQGTSTGAKFNVKITLDQPPFDGWFPPSRVFIPLPNGLKPHPVPATLCQSATAEMGHSTL